MPSASPPTLPPARLTRALKAVVDVHDNEVSALSWSLLDLFCLLAGNYVLRPLRDEAGVAGGVKNLPNMMLATLGATVVVGVVFALATRRWGRPSIQVVYRFLQANLLAFFLLPRFLPSWSAVGTARVFFVWASVYNLFVVSVVWGAMVDRFRSDQARRLFGFLAAGGTLGAIVGSSLVNVLAGRIASEKLFLFIIAFLELGRFAASRAVALCEARTPAPATSAKSKRSPYVIGLALNILCFTITSACVYMEQERIVEAADANPAERTAIFARIDLLVNLVGLGVQLLLTGRIIALLGVGGAASTLPIVTLGGFIALWTRPTLGVLMTFQVVRRAVDYAVARPCREVMYTATKPEGRLGTKALIDTAVYRAGDAVGAWSYGLFTMLPGSFGAAILIAPLTLVWVVVCLVLGRVPSRDKPRVVSSDDV